MIYVGSGAESTWRQIGFVRFDIAAVHVVRLLLPDVIVFLGSLVTLVVNLSAVRLCRSEGVEGVGGGVNEDSEGGDTETANQDGAKPGILNLYSVVHVHVHVICVQFCTCTVHNTCICTYMYIVITCIVGLYNCMRCTCRYSCIDMIMLL